MKDPTMKKKLEDLEMSENEYIKNIAILDFYEFLKLQDYNILDISIKEYIDNLLKYVIDKIMLYGNIYKQHIEEYSLKYLSNLQKSTNDDSLKNIKNNIQIYVNKVNEDYIKMKDLSVAQKILYTKDAIKDLDKYHSSMYLNLLKIRYQTNEHLDVEDIKIYKL